MGEVKPKGNGKRNREADTHSCLMGTGTLAPVGGGAPTEVNYNLCLVSSRPETSVVQEVVRGSISPRDEELSLVSGLYRLNFSDEECVTVRLFNDGKVTGISGL